MSVAFLGWGSLIWDPATLRLASEWHEDGPVLPVEFARHSARERVTLVIERSTPPVQVLWAEAADATIAAARESLRQREGTSSQRIGSWSHAKPVFDELSVSIGEWALARNLTGVVWTALGPRWNGVDGAVPCVEQLLDFLRSQGADSEAARYVRKAPPQIRTPYRRRIEEELGWTYID
jgi:hypothetical protein